MSGIEAVPLLKERWPDAEILMQTVYGDEDRVFKALCSGATGYLLKNTPPAVLIDAIREVHAGGAPMSASIARKVVHFFRMPEVDDEALTPRETEVLDLLVEGKTNREIGEALFISVNTVAYHVKQIYEKLHVHSRAEAVAKALRRRRFR
jgi:DNA-binding NarL/FixJ family response regulator